MLERVEAESSDDCVVMLVTTAVGLDPPYTPAAIEAATTFTMVEDWSLAPGPHGTTLTKTWRDIRADGDPEETVTEYLEHYWPGCTKPGWVRPEAV